MGYMKFSKYIVSTFTYFLNLSGLVAITASQTQQVHRMYGLFLLNADYQVNFGKPYMNHKLSWDKTQGILNVNLILLTWRMW